MKCCRRYWHSDTKESRRRRPAKRRISVQSYSNQSSDLLPRFDDIWEPSEKDTPSVGDFNPDPVKIDITKEEVPPALLMKGNETEISRDEEATVMIQLDILRGIHSNLHHASEEINTLLGFQMLANLITNVVILIMFGFYTIAGALDGKRRRRRRRRVMVNVD